MRYGKERNLITFNAIHEISGIFHVPQNELFNLLHNLHSDYHFYLSIFTIINSTFNKLRVGFNMTIEVAFFLESFKQTVMKLNCDILVLFEA